MSTEFLTMYSAVVTQKRKGVIGFWKFELQRMISWFHVCSVSLYLSKYKVQRLGHKVATKHIISPIWLRRCGVMLVKTTCRRHIQLFVRWRTKFVIVTYLHIWHCVFFGVKWRRRLHDRANLPQKHAPKEEPQAVLLRGKPNQFSLFVIFLRQDHNL